MRRLGVLALVLLSAVAALAQNDTVRIVGRVADSDGNAQNGCILTVLHPADSAIIAYSMTDAEGRYATSFIPQQEEVLLRLTGFNVKRQVRKVEARSQTVDFRAEEESTALREVLVKAQRLWGSRDTLNYLVSAYTREHDRTIGDVLKQLPGITIDDGVIKYQGTPINHFYIENMDVLQGRYGLASEGIRAEDVATVQVLENHEHVRALQDQVPPESAAINLKLKKKARGTWTKSGSVGLGYDDALLWDCDAKLMYFGARRQHILFYGNDNTGHSNDRTVQHYGKGRLGTTVLTSIVMPGIPPVGNSLWNDLHSLSMNNLSKLGETKQLHYNLTYKHDIQRRSAYAQTTYFLPDATTRILTEDITARHTTNDASLQLTYEDNADRHFLNNKLELAGQWDEGRGILQHSFNRNLALSNTTRWVYRTERGGGFELNSTNSVQTTPQALTVEGDTVTLRQDVELLRICSDNTFSLVKDLRRHRWTIVPTAGVSINYVGLESALGSPSVYPGSQLLQNGVGACGTMDYLDARASLGASLRYVKNDFRMSLNLPLSLNYTFVRNANSDGIQKAPSLLGRVGVRHDLLWKATDNWTLSGGADYGSSQTPWNQLFTTCVMSNYRTMNRYVAHLSDSHAASANMKINYKDIFNELFAYVQGTYSRSWSDIIHGTTIDDNAHTVVQAEYMPHHANTYSLTANVSKGIAWHATKVEVTANYQRSDNLMLRQDVRSRLCSSAYGIRGGVNTDITRRVRLAYVCQWAFSRFTSSGYAQDINTFSQKADMNVSLVPGRLLLGVNARHTHNSGLQGRKDYAFMDASLTFRTKRQQEFCLQAENLTNTHTFVQRMASDMTEVLTRYELRPLSLLLSARLRF